MYSVHKVEGSENLHAVWHKDLQSERDTFICSTANFETAHSIAAHLRRPIIDGPEDGYYKIVKRPKGFRVQSFSPNHEMLASSQLVTAYNDALTNLRARMKVGGATAVWVIDQHRGPSNVRMGIVTMEQIEETLKLRKDGTAE